MATTRSLEELLKLNRRLQREVSGSLEVVQKEVEENRMARAKMEDMNTRILHSYQAARGLEVSLRFPHHFSSTSMTDSLNH